VQTTEVFSNPSFIVSFENGTSSLIVARLNNKILHITSDKSSAELKNFTMWFLVWQKDKI